MKELINRWDAVEKGLKRFYTGVPCIRNHDSERFTSNGACILCVNPKLPGRKKLPTPMHFWPPKALFFGNAPGRNVTDVEAHAVFRWMEAAGWHLRALEILRGDPALMARFDHDMTTQEKFATGRSTPDPAPTPAAVA